VDEAQGSNRSKTNPMRDTPKDCEKQTRPLDEPDSSIQIYHTIFSTDNYESAVSLELALQTVFDHAKSQLSESITKRVIQRGQYRCHGNNYHTNHPVLADSIYTAFHTATHEICQPARASDSSAKSHGARRS